MNKKYNDQKGIIEHLRKRHLGLEQEISFTLPNVSPKGLMELFPAPAYFSPNAYTLECRIYRLTFEG